MTVEHRENCRTNSGCELLLGIGSWAQKTGNKKSRSVKFAWKDKNGKIARGGELPVEALAQALEFAIRKGYIALTGNPNSLG